MYNPISYFKNLIFSLLDWLFLKYTDLSKLIYVVECIDELYEYPEEVHDPDVFDKEFILAVPITCSPELVSTLELETAEGSYFVEATYTCTLYKKATFPWREYRNHFEFRPLHRKNPDGSFHIAEDDEPYFIPLNDEERLYRYTTPDIHLTYEAAIEDFRSYLEVKREFKVEANGNS